MCKQGYYIIREPSSERPYFKLHEEPSMHQEGVKLLPNKPLKHILSLGLLINIVL